MAPPVVKRAVNALRVRDSENGRPTDRWTNGDILPVLPENRTYTHKSYLGFWYVSMLEDEDVWPSHTTCLEGLTNKP
jgi:cytosine/uracil/thiamine/allantoin permease